MHIKNKMFTWQRKMSQRINQKISPSREKDWDGRQFYFFIFMAFCNI